MALTSVIERELAKKPGLEKALAEARASLSLSLVEQAHPLRNTPEVEPRIRQLKEQIPNLEAKLKPLTSLETALQSATEVYLHVPPGGGQSPYKLQIAINRGTSSSTIGTYDFEFVIVEKPRPNEVPTFYNQGEVDAYLKLIESPFLESKYPKLQIFGGHSSSEYGDLRIKRSKYSRGDEGQRQIDLQNTLSALQTRFEDKPDPKKGR